MSRIKKTTEEFIKEVDVLVGEVYTVLGEYVGNKNRIKMRHNHCNIVFETTPLNFLKGSRCPKCAGVIKKTHEEFNNEVKTITGDEYLVIGEYRNNNSHILLEHNWIPLNKEHDGECHYKFEVKPRNFLAGSRCPRCAGNIKKTTLIFKEEVLKLVGDEYEILGEYTGANNKVSITHTSCGTKYFTTPSNFLRGNMCPNCR